MIVFTKHAKNKFLILKEHSFKVTKEQVTDTVTNPEKIDRSKLPLLIAQKKIDSRHVLRVIYKK